MSEILSENDLLRIDSQDILDAMQVYKLIQSHRALQTALAAMTKERDRLKKLLDRDHTGLAAALNQMQKIVRGFGWLAADEWGSYDYTQRTEAALRREINDCFNQLNDTAKLALHESGIRADAAFYPERDQLATAQAQLKAQEDESHWLKFGWKKDSKTGEDLTAGETEK